MNEERSASRNSFKYVLKLLFALTVLRMFAIDYKRAIAAESKLLEWAIASESQLLVGERKQNTAAICAIQKGEIPYLEEWVIYNIVVGFDKIYIYDNSDTFHLRSWHTSLPTNVQQRVEIKHFPGLVPQLRAYNDCWERIRDNRMHSWIAFIDVDEFVVIRNRTMYPFIMNLLESLPPHFPGLAINWVIFRFNNQTHFMNRPVTLRFQRRDPRALDPHVKIIVRADLLGRMANPHFAAFNLTNTSKLIPRSRDSRGKKIIGPFNKELQDQDIALYHFWTKSLEEFKGRCNKGRVSAFLDKKTALPCQSSERILEVLLDGLNESIRDSAPWQLLQERAPFFTKKFTSNTQ